MATQYQTSASSPRDVRRIEPLAFRSDAFLPPAPLKEHPHRPHPLQGTRPKPPGTLGRADVQHEHGPPADQRARAPARRAQEFKSVKAALAALTRYHQADVVHRIGELVNDAHAALAATGDSPESAAARAALGKGWRDTGCCWIWPGAGGGQRRRPVPVNYRDGSNAGASTEATTAGHAAAARATTARPPAAAPQVQGQPARRPLPPKLSERQLKAEPQPAHAVADLALARTRACGDDLKDLKYASAAEPSSKDNLASPFGFPRGPTQRAATADRSATLYRPVAR